MNLKFQDGMSLTRKPPSTQYSQALTADFDDKNDQYEINNVFETLELSGHEGAVLTVEYDPTEGQILASAGMDRKILLWNTDTNENLGQITGHKGAITRVRWGRDPDTIFSASADGTIGCWDTESGQKARKLQTKGSSHSKNSSASTSIPPVVNDIALTKRGSELVVSAGDDQILRVWDPRENKNQPSCEIPTDFPLLTVACDSTGERIFSAGVDNIISWWDTRNLSEPTLTTALQGHGECYVTSLEINPNQDTLLSFGTDNAVRAHNIQPFVSSAKSRHIHTYNGAQASHTELNLVRAKWNSDGTKIACGSQDGTLVAWDTLSHRLVQKVPGHIGCVNDVCFHPRVPSRIASASSDGTIRVGQYL